MKYCIGCVHWSFEKGSEGYRYSDMTSDPDIPAHMSCDKGHWRRLDLDEIKQSDIERAMELAENCKDFSERASS